MQYAMLMAEKVRKAENAIREGDLRNAASIYEQLIKRKPQFEKGYSRLMMIYRRQKAVAKEIAVINNGMKQITRAYHNKGQQLFGQNPSVKRLSNALMKSLGLKTARGKNLSEPPIVEMWRSRKERIIKRIHKQKKIHD